MRITTERIAKAIGVTAENLRQLLSVAGLTDGQHPRKHDWTAARVTGVIVFRLLKDVAGVVHRDRKALLYWFWNQTNEQVEAKIADGICWALACNKRCHNILVPWE